MSGERQSAEIDHTRGAAPTPYRELAEVIDNLPLLLREARRARGLSLRGAAEQIGVSFNTVTRAEQGLDLRAHSAAAVLRWLDLSTSPGAQS